MVTIASESLPIEPLKWARSSSSTIATTRRMLSSMLDLSEMAPKSTKVLPYNKQINSFFYLPSSFLLNTLLEYVLWIVPWVKGGTVRTCQKRNLANVVAELIELLSNSVFDKCPTTAVNGDVPLLSCSQLLDIQFC